jgi:hypothetical protein
MNFLPIQIQSEILHTHLATRFLTVWRSRFLLHISRVTPMAKRRRCSDKSRERYHTNAVKMVSCLSGPKISKQEKSDSIVG